MRHFIGGFCVGVVAYAFFGNMRTRTALETYSSIFGFVVWGLLFGGIAWGLWP